MLRAFNIVFDFEFDARTTSTQLFGEAEGTVGVRGGRIRSNLAEKMFFRYFVWFKKEDPPFGLE